MQKAPYVFPIIGGRKVEHLYANMEALDIALTDSQIKELESAVPFDLGFPCNFWVSPIFPRLSYGLYSLSNIFQGNGTAINFTMATAGNFEPPLVLQPYRPKQKDN